MSYDAFLKELIDNPDILRVDKSKIVDYIFELKQSKVNKESIKRIISEQVNKNRIEQLINSLMILAEYCQQPVLYDFVNKTYVDTFLSNLNSILEIVLEVDRETKPHSSNTESTFNKSVDEKVKEIQGKFADFDLKFIDVDEHFKQVENDLRGSYSSLIINNISILGIFVAVAFAGFFSIEIFAKVNINFETAFTRSVFALSLLALLVYNVLLMLFYFIFKINYINRVKENSQPQSFKEVFKQFFVINYVLVSVVAVLFIISLIWT